MQYNLTTTRFTGQKTFIENLGDFYWELLCDQLPQASFKLRDAANVLIDVYGFTPSTARQYAGTILANVIAQDGDPVIKKVGHHYTWV